MIIATVVVELMIDCSRKFIVCVSGIYMHFIAVSTQRNISYKNHATIH